MSDEKDEREKIRQQFLRDIAFTYSREEAIEEEEFDPADYDFVEADGTYSRGPDCLYAIVREDEESVEIYEKEQVDDYWSKGWMLDYCRVRRADFDIYKGKYYKAFPSRIRLSQFEFTKSLRRVLQKNSDLKTVIRPLRITPAKMQLHERHCYVRYGDYPREPLTKTYDYIWHYPSDLTELCVFKNNELIACSIFEVGHRAILTNQAFYAVGEPARSLGTLTILLEIQYAMSRRMKFYYMGNYYKQNPNYQYKARFHGMELMDWETYRWIPFEEANELLKQKLARKRD